jgi:hypothetical protein
MAAGLGFKDFVTGEVLTAADVDGYLMQGVWVFASAAARDAAVTSPQEGNFAYLKDTNVTTYYTGSAWANLDTTGMTNPMTTTGDTIYSSSGSTPARLGIGTTGQVLTVAGGVPSWATPAGGADYVKITSADFSSQSSITLNDVFSSTYNNYKFFVTTTASPGAALRARWRVSGSDASGSDYEWTRLYTSGSTVGAAGASSQTAADISDVGEDIALDLTIYRPFLTEPTLTTGYNLYNAPTSGTDHGFYVSAHNQAVSYTGMTFFPSTSTFSGNYALYGLKV